MDKLINAIQGADDFTALGAATEDQIAQAETQLKLKFSVDYKAYLKAFGAVFIGDKELTGICKSERLNVIPVTVRARSYFPKFPADAYVIQEMLIDHIITIQRADGCIYSYGPLDKETKIASSLYEYLFEINE